MIHVDRQRVPIPASLTSERAHQEYAKAEEAFSRSERMKGYVRFKFSMYRRDDVREALNELFHGKCAFCESSVLASSSGSIEHFRPKSNCVSQQGEHWPQHYWWLANAWSNLYLACEVCNRAKSNRFPILGERSPVASGPEALDAELPLLIDPCHDDPEQHLRFSEDGKVHGRDERGEVTIELFRLNRPNLVRQRVRVVDLLRELSGLDFDPEMQLGEHQPYLGLRRQFLRWDVEERERQRKRSEPPAPDAEPETEPEVEPDSTEAPGGRSFTPDEGDEPDALKGAPELSPDSSLSTEAIDRALDRGVIDRSVLDRLGKVIKSPRSFSLDKHVQTPGHPVDQATGDDDLEVEAERYYFQNRQIERITLRDFKAVESLDLECVANAADGAGWTMFLGENGTGKSSVLEAIALALAGATYREQLLRQMNGDGEGSAEEHAKRLIRRPRHGPRPDRAEVTVVLTDGSEARLTIHDDGSIDANAAANDARVLLLGYGATRLLPRHTVPSRGTAYARVDNLFNPFVPLGDARQWLLGLAPEAFDDLAPALVQLLGLSGDETLVQNHDQQRIDVHLFDSQVPLEQLSSGYQSVVALVADIMSILRERWKSSMAVAEGVVLLDEIGAHLHPKWRMRLVRSLRDTFPRVQFLVSTHDPLCLRGLEDGEVIAMRRDTSGRVSATDDLPPVAGLRVDQLLMSEHFGLSSTIDPDLERAFDRYYELLLLQEREEGLSGDEEAELAELRERLADIRQLGETVRERILLDAIDRHLAREASLESPEIEAQRGELERHLDELLMSMEL